MGNQESNMNNSKTQKNFPPIQKRTIQTNPHKINVQSRNNPPPINNPSLPNNNLRKINTQTNSIQRNSTQRNPSQTNQSQTNSTQTNSTQTNFPPIRANLDENDISEMNEQHNRYMERVFMPQVNMPQTGVGIIPHPSLSSKDDVDVDWKSKNPFEKKKKDFEERINREEQDFLRDLEEKKKNFYKNKEEQLNEFEIELNDFEKNNNPFKILNISYEASESDVKNAYKKLALKYHPDKTELDKNVATHHFKQITKAYIYLMKKFGDLKNVKSQEDIRRDARSYFERQDRDRGNRSQESNMIEADRMRIGENKNFDVNRFNKIFEDNRMETVFDKGYGGKWEEDQVDESSVFNSKFTLDIFNKVFEDNKEAKKYNRPQGQLIKRPEPEALTSGQLTFTEIGMDGIEDFSSGLNSTIGFEDYKAAYTYRSKLEKPEGNRKEYRNVKELEAERSRAQVLSREEKEELERYHKWQDEREMNRILNVKKEEEYLEKYNNQINRLFIKK
jgi:curved DNA-binding protein